MSNSIKHLLTGSAIVLSLCAAAHYSLSAWASAAPSQQTHYEAPFASEVNQSSPQETSSLQAAKKIQVVFALDATGSMANLIGTAKEKIWSIASGFAQTDSTAVEIGLVFYRDKGDEFVTKRIQLSSDLDNVYEQLMAVSANGGGDGPESVNQGLHEAISQMEWNKDTATFKSVFLVGDAPPHMNYRDDVKYPQSCLLAKEKEVVLNTILMGNDNEAKAVWKKIAACSEGDFIQVDMNANNLAVSTPYDDRIAALSSEMDDTRMYYGSTAEKQKQVEKKTQSTKLKENLSSATAARRAEYNNTTKTGKSTYMGNNELVSDYKAGKLNVGNVASDKLPAEMATMNEAQRKNFLEKKVKQRDSLEVLINKLIGERKVYMEKELSKRSKEEVESSFDYAVYENVKKQASKKKIELKGKAKL